MGKSNFKFQIEGTLEQFEHKLRTYHKDTVTSDKRPNRITLHDHVSNSTLVFVKEVDNFVITTSNNSYRYEIFKGENGKTTVKFDGPVNALWQQNLLPKIKYRKGTLVGKYEEEEKYLSIAAYMERRQETIGDANQQDQYGWKVNEIFKNDIPYLQKSFRTKEKRIVRRYS